MLFIFTSSYIQMTDWLAINSISAKLTCHKVAQVIAKQSF